MFLINFLCGGTGGIFRYTSWVDNLTLKGFSFFGFTTVSYIMYDRPLGLRT